MVYWAKGVSERSTRVRVAGFSTRQQNRNTEDVATKEVDRKQSAERGLASSITATVTALGVIGSLVFTGFSLQQTRLQNQINESGQATDRFNSAISDIGSDSLPIRLGGVYSLQSIMRSTPQEQPAIIEVLTAFIRQRAPLDQPRSGASPVASQSPVALANDVQAALDVISERDRANDAGVTVIIENANLEKADLHGADLEGMAFYEVDLAYADLGWTNLKGVHFPLTNLEFADLDYANLSKTDFNPNADLYGASAFGTFLCSAESGRTNLSPWNCVPVASPFSGYPEEP